MVLPLGFLLVEGVGEGGRATERLVGPRVEVMDECVGDVGVDIVEGAYGCDVGGRVAGNGASAKGGSGEDGGRQQGTGDEVERGSGAEG